MTLPQQLPSQAVQNWELRSQCSQTLLAVGGWTVGRQCSSRAWSPHQRPSLSLPLWRSCLLISSQPPDFCVPLFVLCFSSLLHHSPVSWLTPSVSYSVFPRKDLIAFAFGRDARPHQLLAILEMSALTFVSCWFLIHLAELRVTRSCAVKSWQPVLFSPCFSVVDF